MNPFTISSALMICRGSRHDGMGHVIRSRSVAKALRTRVPLKIAVLGEKDLRPLWEGFESDVEFFTDEKEVMRVHRNLDPDISIFDMTRFSESNFRVIRERGMTVSLSPIFNCLSMVDLLFHRSAVEKASWRAEGRPVIRSGLPYAVIGEHCRRISETVFRDHLQADPLSLAVCMGGADAADKTRAVLQTLKHLSHPVLIWVFLGEGYAHSYQALVDELRETKHEIVLVKTNHSMWRIMQTCSLAVLAGGTTTYEAAFAGLPSINTLETPDHRFLIQELEESGVCLCAGDSFSSSLENINPLIARLSGDRGELLSMHRASKGLIDGSGVDRITEEILRQFACRNTGAA